MGFWDKEKGEQGEPHNLGPEHLEQWTDGENSGAHIDWKTKLPWKMLI